MLRREIGPGGPLVSQLTFGTMRLEEAVGDVSAADFLCRLHDDGVTTHHSSSEYETHLTYRSALERARATGRRFQHIVKLAAPSFDAEQFDADFLAAAIDRELSDLQAEQLTCVQWLVRTPDASNEAGHVAILSEQAGLINATLNGLVATGKVGAFVSFPYSVAAARAAASLTSLNGLCVYLNLVEVDFVPLLAQAPALAIRPLAAGKLVHEPAAAGIDAQSLETDDLIRTSMQFPLLHPNVATTIASMRTEEQAAHSINAVRSTTPDQTEFDRLHNIVTAPSRSATED